MTTFSIFAPMNSEAAPYPEERDPLHAEGGYGAHGAGVFILRPEDVSDCEDLRRYFQQRLGLEFDDVPYLMLEAETYKRLVEGKEALLKQMIDQDVRAAFEIFLAFTADETGKMSVILTLSIESPHTGEAALEFIRTHQTTPLHADWLEAMEELTLKMQKLHRQWKRQTVLYHVLPPKQAGP